ncbi:OmpW/AlkL family protein [Roseomonas populi]|uniref:Outer membrane beta-barrel protein n=1 Tax=Roseomonas populi TaxID=3121582 RepID=A0ABT1X1L3_9PROT|nr:OmpW family outer membrane protein [Roseomonas pecuniae]MCR0981985.1 outer membrane beta-barrel protein [Roseomonas pecuniae]
MFIRSGAAAAAFLALSALVSLPAPAQAQEGLFFGQAVRGKRAGDLVLGFGAIGMLPEDGGRVDAIGGKPHASSTATPQLDLSYFLTPNLSLNLIAATTRHDVEVRGSALGAVDLGHVWALPPTLTLQFHPFPQARISPYVGAGLNYTIFYGEGGGRTAPVTKVDVKNDFGYAVNFGVDIEVAPRWLVNLDAKKLWLDPSVSVNSGTIGARADLNPWIVGASVRYRF